MLRFNLLSKGKVYTFMRLSEYDKQAIKEVVNNNFEQTAQVYLFGSRVDDEKHGGDIDLLIVTSLLEKSALEKVNQVYAQLQQKIGEQKLDLIVLSPDTVKQTIHREALKQGILLW